MYLQLYLDVSDRDGTFHVRNNFLCVQQPRSTTAIGLAECVTRALFYMGIDQTWDLDVTVQMSILVMKD